MSEYIPTIGLEIHAELKTATKMFCRSKNDPDEERSNVNICPVCLAHPGTLPVINREAVKHVLRVGIALGGELADYTEFDRKSYFYPDLPKGYQISQYEYPLVKGGELLGVAITRVHLEEDTASSLHDDASGKTTIDFNRAGVPLMELVTDPVIRSADEAARFAQELQLLLRYLGASRANMEKGEMRVEANISMGQKGEMGTKVEIKNLNSFNAMERAVEYEIVRQTKLLERGESVVQETRGWDEGKQATFSQRVKEGSADYRYFPDPDLPSLKLSEISEFAREALESNMPELPEARRARYLALGVGARESDLFTTERKLGDFFDAFLDLNGEADSELLALGANYLANDLVKIIRDIEGRETDYQSDIPISVPNFRKIVSLVAKGEISSRVAKDLLLLCAREDLDPESVVKERGLGKKAADSDLLPLVESILAENPGVVADYKKGKPNALEFLVGKGMKATRGGADPEKLRELFKSKAA